MDISQVKNILAQNNAWGMLRDLIYGEEDAPDFTKKTGLKFELIASGRTIGSGDYDGWQWIFKLDDQLYETDSYYSSWDGFNMNALSDFYEVKEEEKLVKFWVPV